MCNRFSFFNTAINLSFDHTQSEKFLFLFSFEYIADYVCDDEKRAHDTKKEKEEEEE